MRTLLLGEALVDLICHRPVAALSEVDAFVPHFGGSAANIAVTAARNGGRVALAGAAGDDAWGRWMREHMAREGVALDWFELRPELATPVCFTTLDERGEPTYAVYGDSIPAVVDALERSAHDALEACEALFLTSNTLVGERERTLTLGLRDRARELGRPVVVDANIRANRWEAPAFAASETRELVKGAFLVKCNREEARLLSGEDDPAAAAAGLLAMGAQHVIVTRDADGAIVRGGGMKVDVPGRPAQVRSSLGAGDAFAGVVLARLSATDFYAPAIAAALRDAVEEGARAVERWGALG